MRIMINNINVVDCEFRGYCNICKLKSGSNCPTDCKDNPNCYYKQLKLAENQIVDLNKMVEIKEQECEELKKVNEEKNELLAKLGCPTIATARMKVLCLQDQLKQTLKEIKEIANHCINQDLCTFCNYNDKCYKGFEDEALSYDVCKLILEKISEVLDE